jgi:hypothetical protein
MERQALLARIAKHHNRIDQVQADLAELCREGETIARLIAQLEEKLLRGGCNAR